MCHHLEAKTFDKKNLTEEWLQWILFETSLAYIYTGPDSEQIVLLLYLAHRRMGNEWIRKYTWPVGEKHPKEYVYAWNPTDV